MATTEVDRLRNRFMLCCSEVERCKRDLLFWVREKAAVLNALTAQDQYCFDFYKELFDEKA